MITGAQNGVPFFQFHNLATFAGLWHGIFTRQGGISPAPFESLNVGHRLGDNPDHVKANREIISQCTSSSSIISARQVHGCHVQIVTEVQQPAGAACSSRLEADALVTNLPGIYLMIQVADCQSILIYDPVRQVVGNIHSGWRGSLQNICSRTIETMVTAFGCRAEDLWVGIGPSLGPCCAEFIHYQQEIPEIYWHYRIDECHFDFWSITKDQLRAAGVKPHKIEISSLCTHCRTDLFYSYRKEGLTGRFATIIGLSHQ
jgi:YfiH family protein